ncbi:MAG: pilus assembly protein TadG-related protein [bacterium]|nr:pilus assembly protein TadG-related protein [bacterium]
MLVLFALLLVGLFGLLGVLVDGGRLRVTHQQMLAGVEHAALEGVRFKDLEDDAGRRLRARQALERQWDDDLDPQNGSRLDLGAGALPVQPEEVALGAKIMAAAPGARNWRPAAALQDNLANAPHGDLVAGAFVPGFALALEDDDFNRNDFVPVTTGSDPGLLAAAPAFLVRLRRTDGRLVLDDVADVSSSGPAFEWLWARGGAWQEPGDGEVAQSRADGLTVRAAGIAAVERALYVSTTPDGAAVLATFALRGGTDAPWTGVNVGDSITFDVREDGVLLAGTLEAGVVSAIAPRLVGATVAPGAAPPTASAVALIVPVYGVIAGERRVAGFELARAQATETALTVIRVRGGVLPSGASAVAPVTLDARLALAASPELRALHFALSEPLQAPVLRR